MNKYVLPGAALLSLVSNYARAATCTLIGATPCTFNEVASTANPAPAGSPGLGPLGAVGGIGGPVAFTAPFAGTLVMTVNPTVVSPTMSPSPGSVYQAFVDGNFLGHTAEVPLFGPNLTSGTFTTPVSAGPHNFDINDQILSYIGAPPPFGSDDPTVTSVPASFNPNSVTIVLTEELPSAVAEPRSLWVLLSGLLGLGFLWARRVV